MVETISRVAVNQEVLAEADDVTLVVEAGADEQCVDVGRGDGQLEGLVHFPRGRSAMSDGD